MRPGGRADAVQHRVHPLRQPFPSREPAVRAEVGKAVYKAEGLAPPSLAQFKQAYEASVKFLQTPAQQKALQEKITSLPLNKATFTKAAVYGIHGLAFFSIGEIIGRRSFFGYPALGHAEHH